MTMAMFFLETAAQANAKSRLDSNALEVITHQKTNALKFVETEKIWD